MFQSYSTVTALIDLSDRIKFSMDKGLYTGMVMIDLQKAFDTVYHAIMSDEIGAWCLIYRHKGHFIRPRGSYLRHTAGLHIGTFVFNVCE